jgi:hypothetical protein
MRTVAVRSVVGGLALGLLVVTAFGCASKHHTQDVDPSIIPKLAGKWTGYVTAQSGSSAPADLSIQPDGSYVMVIPQVPIETRGTISVVGGQLRFNRTAITGPSQDLAVASGTFDYSESADGKSQTLSGFGSSDRGPFSSSVTKRP